MYIDLRIEMQVGKPSGKNAANFRGDEGGSIMNKNTLLDRKMCMRLGAFKRE
jgi:hypothetical protein